MSMSMELFQGPVTRTIYRKIEEENKGMVAMFKKNFQGLAWNALEGEDKDQRGSKTLVISIMKEWKSKESSIEDFGDLNIKWKLENHLTARR